MSYASPMPPMKPAKPVRFGWLDVLRLFAIVDIVGVHVDKVHTFRGMGLPIFLLCSIALGAKRHPPRPLGEQVQRRASRLLPPYVFWCVAYLVFNTIQHEVTGRWRFATLTGMTWENLFFGTEYLLWYLPFIFLAEALVSAIQQGTKRLEAAKPVLFVAGCLLIGVMFELFRPDPRVFLDLDHMSEQRRQIVSWYRALPAIPLGLALAVTLRSLPRRRWLVLLWIAAGVALYFARLPVTEFVDWQTYPDWSRRYGMGMALIGLVVLIPFQPPKWMLWFTGFTFGIYLIHIMAAWPVRAATDALGWSGHIVWLVVILSAAITCGLKRTPWVKKFL